MPISEVIDDLANQQQHEALTLAVENRLPGTLQVNLSRDAFISAMQNLINNACEAADSSALTLRIQAMINSDDDVEIVITDNGPGIPAELKSRLFEPFVTTRTNGTGLGLAVVNAVIRAHKGRISVSDASPCGTSFTITLPVFKISEQ